MTNLIRTCINDYTKNDFHPLQGLLDWLIFDRNVPLERIYKIAFERFGIPRNVVEATILSLM